MNKKFSTLVATLLLSGALVSVNATDVKTLADFKADATTYTVTNMGDSKIDFLADISLDESTPYLLIDQNNLIIHFALSDYGQQLSMDMVRYLQAVWLLQVKM